MASTCVNDKDDIPTKERRRKRSKNEEDIRVEKEICRPMHDECVVFIKHLLASIEGMEHEMPVKTDSEHPICCDIPKMRQMMDSIKQTLRKSLDHFSISQHDYIVIDVINKGPSTGMTVEEIVDEFPCNIDEKTIRTELKYLERDNAIQISRVGDSERFITWCVIDHNHLPFWFLTKK
jgi:hypothetical protein